MMPVQVGTPGPHLDIFIDDGLGHLFDPAEVDLDAPPSENESVIVSDMFIKLEDCR